MFKEIMGETRFDNRLRMRTGASFHRIQETRLFVDAIHENLTVPFDQIGPIVHEILADLARPGAVSSVVVIYHPLKQCLIYDTPAYKELV